MYNYLIFPFGNLLRAPAVVTPAADAVLRRAEVRVEVAGVRERDRGRVAGHAELDDRVLGVGGVVEEGLAVGGLLERLRLLLDLLVDEGLLGLVENRVGRGRGRLGAVRVVGGRVRGDDRLRGGAHDTHRDEELLELLHLGGAHVLDRGGGLGGLAPHPLRRLGRHRLRRRHRRAGRRGLALGLLVDTHEGGVRVVSAAGAGALLLLRVALLLPDLLLDHGHESAHGHLPVAALRHAGLVGLAPGGAALEARAVLGRVALALAVTALGRLEERARHLAALLLLDPVARVVRERAAGMVAEGAVHCEGLRRRLCRLSHLSGSLGRHCFLKVF